jgi:hypothetical protein
MTNICLLQRYYVFLSRFNRQSNQVEKWDSSIHTLGTEWNISSSTRSMPPLATAVEYHVPSLKFGHRNRGGCRASFIKWLRLCLSYDMIFWPSQNQISVCDTMLFWPRTTLCVFWVSRFRKRSEKKKTLGFRNSCSWLPSYYTLTLRRTQQVLEGQIQCATRSPKNTVLQL